MQIPVQLRDLSPRVEVLVDQYGFLLTDPDLNILGPPPLATLFPGERLVFALPTNVTGGALSVRYHPPKDIEEESVFGMSFENVIPAGVGIARAALQFFNNDVINAQTSDLKHEGPLEVRGRVVYATVSGGIQGKDYQLYWKVTDTDGNIWPRTALLLASSTS